MNRARLLITDFRQGSGTHVARLSGTGVINELEINPSPIKHHETYALGGGGYRSELEIFWNVQNAQ
jgi:hypothetical protein